MLCDAKLILGEVGLHTYATNALAENLGLILLYVIQSTIQICTKYIQIDGSVSK